MRIKREVIHDLGEYMNAVAKIANMTEEKSSPVLWFRGISNATYSLIPSLFRIGTYADRIAGGGSYTKLHYAEDIRTQHYIAKNFHLLSSEPSSRVEWLEVMQHHQVNTRVLDWSESSVHSLLFAIEAFLDNVKYTEEKRQKCVPAVWVLNPKKLNKRIVEYIADNEGLQKKLLKELNLTLRDKQAIINILRAYKDLEQYSETRGTKHLDYILNLSSINDEMTRDRSRLKELLIEGDIWNPIYYFISRIYSDGYLLTDRKIPPLCVVHPYHSERIKAQKGVFTVFPFYEENENDKILRKYNMNPDALDQNPMAEDCLYQIVIRNPQKVAWQLMENGMNDSWLYPEMPVVSSEIENRKIY